MRTERPRTAQQAQRLRQAVEREAWDGAWYRRAFFDDGTPLGSHANDECQIDSLAQSWSVIAGGDPRAIDDRHAIGRRAFGAGRRAARAAADAAVRQDAARPGLHQGLSRPASAKTAGSTRTPRCG